jgi:hypothetical protein
MRVNVTITITAGTPINLAVAMGFTTAALLAKAPPIPVNRCVVQMLIGGTGCGYVMNMEQYAPGKTPVATTSGHLTAQLAPATATAPGGSFSDFVSGAPACGPGDLTKLWVDGSNSGDTLAASADLRLT